MEKLPIEEYKQELGIRGRDYILQSNGIAPTKNNIKCLSPTHNDKKPSMGWDENANHFHCFSCGYTFDIFNHLQDSEGLTFIESLDKVAQMIGRQTFKTTFVEEAKKEELNKVPLRDIRYLEKRGMSKNTIKTFGAKEISGEVAFIYHDMSGDIVGVKYRGVKKKRFRAEKGSQFNLYNMVNVTLGGDLIITEGEIDAMTVYECGHKNVVSIPTGVSNTKWITDNWEWLQEFESYTVLFDNDSAGKAGLKETIGRLGETSVKVAKIPEGSDVNDIYVNEAREMYKENYHENMEAKEKTQLMKESFKYAQVIVDVLIEDAKFIPIDGLENFDDISMESQEADFYISTGFQGIDYHLNDLQPGEITVVFGRENEGKTTFLGQVINSIVNQGEKVFWYNGEMKLKKLKTWLYSQVIGSDGEGTHYKTVTMNKATVKKFNNKTLTALKRWHEDKIYMMNSYNVTSHLDIYEKIIASYKRYGTKIVVIDNLASILDGSGDNQNLMETNFIKELNKIKKKYSMHFIIVGHPNGYKGKGELLESKDLSGSKNIPNLIDNMISVMRIYKNEQNEREMAGKIYDDSISLRTDIIKDRNIGKRKTYLYEFDDNSKRFLELAKDGTGEEYVLEKEYDWEQYLDDEITFYNGEVQQMLKKDKIKLV